MVTGTTRRSARTAAGRLQVSFFVSVALVPMLLTQVFAGIGGWFPWWGWSLVLASVIALLFLLALRTERRRHRLRRSRPTSVRSARRREVITDLVITVNPDKPGQQSLHTLLPHLPALRRLYALTGQRAGGSGGTDPTADAESAVREMVAQAGRPDVQCRVLVALPSFDVEQSTIDALAKRLAGLDDAKAAGHVLAVDVTGGTIPMSLTAYLAAARAGLPVTYTSSEPPAKRGGEYRWRDLIAVHDPDTLLTGPPVERETT